jgi:hypothetical protein
MKGCKVMVGPVIACLSLLGLVVVSAGPAAASPTVTITAPVSGATETGVVEVDATAAADAGDSPVLITFSVISGASSSPSVFGQADCFGGSQTCSGSTDWVAAGYPGQDQLIATVSTQNGLSATSQPVDVTVPQTTVAITSPTNGATIEGRVTIAVTATAVPGDNPLYITVGSDGKQIGTVNCLTTNQICSGSVPWDTTGLSGSYEIGATVQTAGVRSASSSFVDVTIVSPRPTITITNPRNGAVLTLGKTLVRVNARTDPSQTDAPSSGWVTANDVLIKRFECSGAQTCGAAFYWRPLATGHYELQAGVTTERSVRATSASVGVVVKPATRHH